MLLKFNILNAIRRVHTYLTHCVAAGFENVPFATQIVFGSNVFICTGSKWHKSYVISGYELNIFYSQIHGVDSHKTKIHRNAWNNFIQNMYIYTVQIQCSGCYKTYLYFSASTAENAERNLSRAACVTGVNSSAIRLASVTRIQWDKSWKRN